MKLSVIIVLAFLSVTSVIRLQGQEHGGWEKVFDSTKVTINSIACTGEGRCVVVGHYARFSNYQRNFMGLSIDSGATWIEPDYPILPESDWHFDVELTWVTAITPALWLAVGAGGQLLRSVDSGRTWTASASSEHGHWKSADFVDEQVGYVIADFPKGKTLRTGDGGVSWEDVSVPNSNPESGSNDIVAISAVGNDTVVMINGSIATSGPMSPGILRSVDRGRNWIHITPTILDGTIPYDRLRLFAIHMLDDRRGIAAGRLDGTSASPHRTVALYTEDGGYGWSVELDTLIHPTRNYEIRALFPVEEGYIIGVTDNGTLLERSPDGTWRSVVGSPFTGPHEYEGDYYYGAGFATRTFGLLSDGFRRIWRYSTGGISSVFLSDSPFCSSGDLRAVPNPLPASHPLLSLTIDPDIEGKVELIDPVGRQLLSIDIEQLRNQGSTLSLPFEAIPSGAFFLRLVTSKGETTVRMVLVE